MKLSDFKDEKAIEVVAELLIPIGNILVKMKGLDPKKSTLEIAKDILKASPNDVKHMLAILSDVPVEKYHCTAATVLRDVVEMFSDDDMMQLFGLQSVTRTSSGSASGSTEV